VKKKDAEQIDPHTRESHIAEGFEKHSEPITTPVSATGIPMQLISPMPGLTPTPVFEPSVPLKRELIEIEGIDEKTAAQLREFGIKDSNDLAKASAKSLAKNLGLPVGTTQKWIENAKTTQK